jgi:hypothetical protein
MSESFQLALSEAARSLKISESVVAFFLLAASLRPALGSVGPMREAIRSTLDACGAQSLQLPLFGLGHETIRFFFIIKALLRSHVGIVSLLEESVSVKGNPNVQDRSDSLWHGVCYAC